ncbi:hypothetical protein O1611_g9609 [Lasiodiplodia mahajangana]|uniref:Uncharacterized protein n=1 Tax=Lasiodiplodia mahajangana TaxID=1108764 RepID=A0ACC2J779_9PEZI|nr:hypothetical protein O1611_g9609 [Lasiodiplodia mahajangana]
MPSDIYLLRSNAELILPTEEEPHHQIAMTDASKKCKLVIAATKPFPNLLAFHPLHPEWESKKAQPVDYVSVVHGERCDCASWTKTPRDVFDRWQHIHELLRYKVSDDAAHAFYAVIDDYQTAEAVAHASLVASLGLGIQVPECYKPLIMEFGASALVEALREEGEDDMIPMLSRSSLGSDDLTESFVFEQRRLLGM